MRLTNGSATAKRPPSRCRNGWRWGPTIAATSTACGRYARITVWSPYSCAPRTECGSWCSPASSRSKSTRSGARYLLVYCFDCVIPSLSAQQLRACGFRHAWQVHDMCDVLRRIETDVIRLTPVVFLTGDLVANPEAFVPLHPQRGHVQPQRRFLGAERVQCHHHEHCVAGRWVELGVDQHRVVIHVVEPDRAQLAQGGMKSPNLVELTDERLEGLVAFECALEITRPQLVFLRIQVLLAALPDRPVFEPLIGTVHATRRAHRARQHRADREHARAAPLQALVQDVRGVDEQVRPRVVRVLGDVLSEFAELPLAGAPGEVRVGLRESQFREAG